MNASAVCVRKHAPSVSLSCGINLDGTGSFVLYVDVCTERLFSQTVSVILRYELRMRYLPKGYLSHFSEDKPSLNYLYHQVRPHNKIICSLIHHLLSLPPFCFLSFNKASMT